MPTTRRNRQTDPILRTNGIWVIYQNVPEQTFCPSVKSKFEHLFGDSIRGLSIGVEEYPDRPEHYHCHVLCHFKSRMSWKSSDICIDEIKAHGENATWNKSSVQRLDTYCQKEASTEFPHRHYTSFTHENTVAKDREIHFASAIASKTRKEAEDIIRLHEPGTYVKNYSNVQAFLSGCYSGERDTYSTPEGIDFDVPEDIQEWKVKEIDNFLVGK